MRASSAATGRPTVAAALADVDPAHVDLLRRLLGPHLGPGFTLAVDGEVVARGPELQERPGLPQVQHLTEMAVQQHEYLCAELRRMRDEYEQDHAEERAILRTLCAYGAIALVNADAQLELLNKNFELERLVSTDLLTGLFNRRHLDAALHRELSLAQRQGLPLSLIAIDVDHFKAINDQHGHPAGDQALSRIGSLLSAHVRNTDVVGRWGGEEFVVVCPGASLEMATQVAENLRRCIAECDLGVNASATASFGVAALHLGDTVHTLSSRADQALYSAKAAGRNCVRAEG